MIKYPNKRKSNLYFDIDSFKDCLHSKIDFSTDDTDLLESIEYCNNEIERIKVLWSWVDDELNSKENKLHFKKMRNIFINKPEYYNGLSYENNLIEYREYRDNSIAEIGNLINNLIKEFNQYE